MSSSNIPFLRTPESRFQNIPDFTYKPHYLTNGNLQMAYIDERVGEGQSPDTFLCLHGQPTWSYLYRKMIPVFLHYTTKPGSATRRVVVPDLFGFGRSDKPVDDAIYTVDFHREALLHFIRQLDLRNITLVVQDWGGIIGLTLPLEDPWRYKRLIVMNTTIPVGRDISPGFRAWRDFSNRSPDMKVGALLGRSCRHLTKTEMEAYDAPYPDQRYKAGVRQFPKLVMIEPGMPGIDISEKTLSLYQTSEQFRTEDIFMACGPKDPVMGTEIMKTLSTVWKNGCYYTSIPEAGHFVQEWGDQVARLAIQVFENPGSAVNGVQKIEPNRTKL
ncbi:putative haloalkane dehalogenase [Xylogone sp. PMI_703]|nr:putative haloalkane dehalogenase [Xylogone sp. PMI_703]